LNLNLKVLKSPSPVPFELRDQRFELRMFSVDLLLDHVDPVL
jgi:hypothetical protein